MAFLNIGRENGNADAGVFGEDLRCRIGAEHSRHIDVHGAVIRRTAIHDFQCLVTVSGFDDDPLRVFGKYQRAYHHARHAAIIHNE